MSYQGISDEGEVVPYMCASFHEAEINLTTPSGVKRRSPTWGGSESFKHVCCIFEDKLALFTLYGRMIPKTISASKTASSTATKDAWYVLR